MKILFTRSNENETDHLSDLLIHGFVQLGHEVIDAPRIWHIYNDGKPGPDGRHRHELHGRGFTLTGILPDDSHVDRTNIEDKIRNRYFDHVVLSRADFKSPYEDLILETYPADRIIIIDGKDNPDLTNYQDHIVPNEKEFKGIYEHLVVPVHPDTKVFVLDTPFIDHGKLIDRGTYFKREILFDDPKVHPIGFSFPKEKIVDRTNIAKEKLWSGAKPVDGDNKTKVYMFDNELDYYTDYAKSYFGKTKMKGGWDCMRHHEIMASGCVPDFEDLINCPPRTCTHLPKDELHAVTHLLSTRGDEWFATEEGQIVYKELQESIYNHFLNHCTTEAMAKYVLDTHLGNR